MVGLCAVCGREFCQYGQHHKTCSRICKAKLNPSPRKHAIITGLGGKCVVCGDSLRFPATGNAGHFCSLVCRKELTALRQRIKSRRIAESRGDTACHTCGGPVKRAVTSGKPFKYCGERCRRSRNANKSTAIHIKTCKFCDKVFSTRHRSQLYCGNECRVESGKATRRSIGVGSSHERRCNKYQKKYVFIDPQKVFARDQWLCRICLAPVDQDTVFPDPLAATLDHIVPLSRGGEHSLDNIRTAHWGCNAAKHNKLDEEIKWQADALKHQLRSSD